MGVHVNAGDGTVKSDHQTSLKFWPTPTPPKTIIRFVVGSRIAECK
jgi:hypothetical protein